MTDHDALASQHPEIHEPTDASVPTEPVSRRLPSSAGGPTRWRWAVALLVVVLAATATIAGGVLLTGARSTSTVARWAPADALVYAELRPDLPGGQRDQLAAFLSAFPGFADRSTLEQKLTEVYDKLVSNASKGKQSYSADIAPWFGGQLGVAVQPPVIPTSGTAAAGTTPPPTLLVATSTDPTKALAWFRSTAADTGAQVMPGDVGGTTLLVASVQGQTIAAAAPAGVLLVGDEASVRAALARDGANGLATDAGFQAAVAALPADGLATVYVHVAGYADMLLARMAGISAGSAVAPDLASLLPAWSAATLQAGSDALSVDGAAPATKATTAVPDGPTVLPGRLPSSTIALEETKDVGVAATAVMSLLGTASRTQLDALLARVGGLDALAGWAGEGGVAVVRTAAGPLPGVVAIATDPKGAAAFAASLSNLATLAGMKPVETTYAGHTITTVGLAGASGCLPGSTCAAPLPGGSTAPAGTVLREGSWTVAGDLFVAGAGPAFVQVVLDTKPGATLADSSRFAAMAGRVASSNHAFAWLDVAAFRDLAVAKMTAAERTRYQADLAPYLAPFDGAVGAATHDGSLERAQGILIVTRP
jgi:Protein of unknown function (DUF3352)